MAAGDKCRINHINNECSVASTRRRRFLWAGLVRDAPGEGWDFQNEWDSDEKGTPSREEDLLHSIFVAGMRMGCFDGIDK